MSGFIECSEKKLCCTCDEKVVHVDGGAKLSALNHPSFPGEKGTLVDIILRLYGENVDEELDFVAPHKLLDPEGIVCSVCLEKLVTCYSRQEKVTSANASLTLASKDG